MMWMWIAAYAAVACLAAVGMGFLTGRSRTKFERIEIVLCALWPLALVGMALSVFHEIGERWGKAIYRRKVGR